MEDIKGTITDAAPRHKLEKPYPYSDLWVHPPDPTMRATIQVKDHQLRSVFVWLPELSHPHAVRGRRPPCPRCRTNHRLIVKGWTQQGPRRAILRDSCCDLLCKYYLCHACVEKNERLPNPSAADFALCLSVWYTVSSVLAPCEFCASFVLGCDCTLTGRGDSCRNRVPEGVSPVEIPC